LHVVVTYQKSQVVLYFLIVYSALISRRES
jgi:hypothetical protein